MYRFQERRKIKVPIFKYGGDMIKSGETIGVYTTSSDLDYKAQPHNIVGALVNQAFDVQKNINKATGQVAAGNYVREYFLQKYPAFTSATVLKSNCQQPGSQVDYCIVLDVKPGLKKYRRKYGEITRTVLDVVINMTNKSTGQLLWNDAVKLESDSYPIEGSDGDGSSLVKQYKKLSQQAMDILLVDLDKPPFERQWLDVKAKGKVKGVGDKILEY
jgi:hypothetical protein